MATNRIAEYLSDAHLTSDERREAEDIDRLYWAAFRDGREYERNERPLDWSQFWWGVSAGILVTCVLLWKVQG